MASQVRSARSGSGWTNSGNIASNDGVYATHTKSSLGFGATLRAYNFGFNIPSGAIINGILVRYERRASADGIRTGNVQVSPDATPRGDALSTLDLWPTSDAYESWGGTSYLWGQSWTAEQINSANFSVFIAASWMFSRSITAYIDHVEVTVYYTETTGTVTGTVRDAITLQPLSGVTVSSDDGRSTTTNVNGVYTLSSVTPGSRKITFSRSGYTPKTVSVGVAGGVTHTLDVNLSPAVIPILLATSSSGDGGMRVLSSILLGSGSDSEASVLRGLDILLRAVQSNSGMLRLWLALTLSGVSGSLPVLVMARTWSLILAAASSGQETMTRVVTRVLGAWSGWVTHLVRWIRVALKGVGDGSTAFDWRSSLSMFLAATSTWTASTVTGFIKGLWLAAANSSTTILHRVVLVRFSTQQSGFASLRSRISLLLQAVSGFGASCRQAYVLLFKAVSSQAGSLWRRVRISMQASSVSSPVLLRHISVHLSLISSWQAFRDAARGLFLLATSNHDASITWLGRVMKRVIRGFITQVIEVTGLIRKRR